jgi:CelD/BcsL family acetyltransferase involved in cellulose biosynthesis
MSTAQLTACDSVFITKADELSSTGAASGAAECVSPLSVPDWDAMLARHPESSFFQSAAWSAVLADTYGYAPRYFILREAGALRGLLPLMEVDSWLTGRRGISLPFTDDCEPICADAETFKSLVPSAIALGRSRKWKHIEFRGGRKWFGDVPASLAFHAHTLDLNGNEEALFARVDPAVRRAIRKAEKEGVRVEFAASMKAMREFYGLFCRTRKKHGLPPQPFKFFENIHRHVISQKLGTIALARHQGAAIAGAVYFNFGGKAIYKFGASDESFQQLRGNNLVMWEAIKLHARNGCRTLSMGRTSVGNEGLRRFKLGWGASEERLEYVKYDLRSDRFLTDKDESSGWHNSVFQVMPTPLAKLAGAFLYPHWA